MGKRRLYGVMLLLAILIAFGWLLASAGRVVAPIVPEPEKQNMPTSVYPPLSQLDEIDIYATVIREIGKRDMPIYILDSTDDRDVRPLSLQSTSIALSPSTLIGIVAALADLSPKITSLDQFPEAEDDAQFRRLKDGGAVITLGNLKPDGSVRVRLGAKIYRSMVDGIGYSIIVEKLNGVWTITDLTVTRVS